MKAAMAAKITLLAAGGGGAISKAYG